MVLHYYMFIVMSYLKNKLQDKIRKYLRRKNKVNSKIKSLNPDYRLLVERSNLYVKAQVLDAVCSDKSATGATKTERAANAGENFAVVLKEKNVSSLTFDRNGYLYHGRIKAFADGLRKGGIQF